MRLSRGNSIIAAAPALPPPLPSTGRQRLPAAGPA